MTNSSRLQETLNTVPPITLGTILLCCTLYLVQLVFDLRLTDWTLVATLWWQQPYRFGTSALLHHGPMHLGMNMLSMFALGKMVEQRIGSFRLLFTILASILGTGVVHVAMAWLGAMVLGMHELLRQHSIGFSGVLFHLTVLECNQHSGASRSLFGFVQVPAPLYPYALYVGPCLLFLSVWYISAPLQFQAVCV